MNCPSCALEPGVEVVVVYKRSFQAEIHQGTKSFVHEHRVTSEDEGDLFGGGHLVTLGDPLTGVVVWADELEAVPA